MPADLPTSPFRGLLLGSGGALAEPGMAEQVIELTGRPAAGLEVLYLGTATYDAEAPRTGQLEGFLAIGCRVTALEVATAEPAPAVMHELVEAASIIVVSGGNTLYAVDRWARLGLDELLRAAITRGAVACGGSAGAICWFDGGHSDSMDPTTYRAPLPADHPRARDWSYIRVDGLGLLPGLLCPHYDRTQANGVPRAADFGAMLRRHRGEDGLGLDHWAGLLVDGPRYRVISPTGREGSLRAGRFVSDGSGVPALWACEARGEAPTTMPAPPDGDLSDIVRPARTIEPDPRVAEARRANPVPGPAAASYTLGTMSEAPRPPAIEYRETARHDVVEVVRGGVVIGTIGPFGLSAGQFGSRWMATTPAGTRSGVMVSRDAAAAWLAERADH